MKIVAGEGKKREIVGGLEGGSGGGRSGEGGPGQGVVSNCNHNCKCTYDEAAGASHDSPKAQTCTFQGPSVEKHENSTGRNPEREKNRAKIWAVRQRDPEEERSGGGRFGRGGSGAGNCNYNWDFHYNVNYNYYYNCNYNCILAQAISCSNFSLLTRDRRRKLASFQPVGLEECWRTVNCRCGFRCVSHPGPANKRRRTQRLGRCSDCGTATPVPMMSCVG